MEITDLTLSDAQQLIKDINIKIRSQYYTEKEAIEEIVKIFALYGIDCGFRSKSPSFYIINEE